jgi:hypothetical protein
MTLRISCLVNTLGLCPLVHFRCTFNYILFQIAYSNALWPCLKLCIHLHQNKILHKNLYIDLPVQRLRTYLSYQHTTGASTMVLSHLLIDWNIYHNFITFKYKIINGYTNKDGCTFFTPVTLVKNQKWRPHYQGNF